MISLFLLLAAPEAPPRPPPELSQLQVFVGSWACEATVPAGAGVPARRIRSSVRIAPDLGGFWFSVRFEEPGGLKAQAYWGYDPALRQFVETAVDSQGGISSSTSPGWQRDRLVWTGELLFEGGKTSLRDTFSKRGTEILHTAEVEGNGRYTVVLEETCRSAPR